MEATRNLAKNISAIRALRGLSQVRFAMELGISKSTLQKIEMGNSPNLDTLECMAKSLRLPVSTLVANSPSSTQIDIFLHIIQGLNWCSEWDQEDQVLILDLICQIAQLFNKNFDQKQSSEQQSQDGKILSGRTLG